MRPSIQLAMKRQTKTGGRFQSLPPRAQPGGAGNPKSEIRNKFAPMEIAKMEKREAGSFVAACEQLWLLQYRDRNEPSRPWGSVRSLAALACLAGKSQR
jgi:hypothetical protein